MKNVKARVIATAANVALGLGVLYMSNNIDSTLLESSFKEAPPSWQLRDRSEDSGILDGRYVVFLQQYSPEILAAAKRYGVSPILIDAAIVEENDHRSIKEDWKDTIAVAWNKTVGSWTGYTIDASLGPGQVNMSTAQLLDDHFHHAKILDVNYLMERLQDPASNIEYVAMNLSYLTNRPNRQPILGTILDDHHLIGVIGTEYVRGPTPTSLAEAEVSLEGGMKFAKAVGMIPTQQIHNLGRSIIEPAKQEAILVYARGISDQYEREYKSTLAYKIFEMPESTQP